MSGEGRGRRLILVELTRLLVVGLSTAAGYEVAKRAVGSDSTRFILGPLLGATVGYVLGGVLGRTLVTATGFVEGRVSKTSSADLVAGFMGLVGALAIATLFGWPLLLVPVRWVGLASLFFMLVLLGSFGWGIGLAKREDLLQLFGITYRTRASDLKVLDSSAVMDPRLLDCVRSGFVRGILLVGEFVLEEVQSFADASDPVRRSRGRRGLEMLSTLSNEGLADLRVIERSYPQYAEVDAKVVALARERGASIVTNDVALGRIAELQGIQVLSLNSLADALRSPVLPGEQIAVQISKEGREEGQGVGFLEDGSMVVVEGGRGMIGSQIRVLVTSVIQTSGGRMIFGKPAVEA